MQSFSAGGRHIGPKFAVDQQAAAIALAFRSAAVLCRFWLVLTVPLSEQTHHCPGALDGAPTRLRFGLGQCCAAFDLNLPAGKPLFRAQPLISLA
jgi:hypothetical protein